MRSFCAVTIHYSKEVDNGLREIQTGHGAGCAKESCKQGVEAETAVQRIDKLNDGYDALTVKAPGSVIGVNINLTSAFAAYEDGRDYIDIVERASDQA